ncbi:MAG: hypothetical protein R8G01_06285 [Ilumatobacteraceae bacterium]|nr:hypothetical protein [Ilumatobacteraceae bacterium]
MTAVKQRRTRSTALAFAAAVFGLGAAAVLGVSGVRSLSDSTAGRQADGQREARRSQRLPFTSTALVGVIDDDERLTSAAVWILEPNGVGGSIVGLAATADAASGTFDTLSPLAAVYEVGGVQEFLTASERLTGLSFDVVEIVDPPRFAQLVAPLGDLPAVLPVSFGDASSDEQWTSGQTTLSSAAAARAITATDPDAADWTFEPARAAVWEAVADRVGAGVGSVAPIASDQDVPIPTDLDQFSDRLFGAAVEYRPLSFRPIDPGRVESQLVDAFVGALGSVDAVVAHDRAEMVMLFGAAAPGRLGAPLDAPVFRVVSPFSESDLDGFGVNSSDVLKRAIDGLFFAQANIVSVADLAGGEVPDVTQVLVADPETSGAVREVYAPLFGEIEVVPATIRIDGIDVEVTLGRSFLEQLRGESPATVAGSEDDESNDATADDG